MTNYKPHEPEVPPQAKDYKPDLAATSMEEDRIALDQAITWLKNFWWENRDVGPRTAERAAWETDRAILALIILKNAPSYEENQND